MQKIKSALFVSLGMLVLTGCGMEVITPEEKATTENTGSGAEVAVERTCEVAEYDRCVAQFQLAQKDMESCQKETKKCEDNLQAYQKKMKENKTIVERLNGIFKNYTETTPQTEYKFDLCGKVGSFENKPWFADFRTTLESNPIPFAEAGRNLKTEDFTGGCFSSEKNIAFFMGAETDGMPETTGSGTEVFEAENIFEFHLIKYDITTKAIQEVLMAEGICETDTCPAIFNTRVGSHIPMTGIGQNEECNYKYFFDQNILVREGCVAR